MRLEDEIHQSKFSNEYHKLSVNLIFTGSWMNSRNIQFFKKYNISLQQYNVLRILRGQYPNPVTVNLLIERMLDKMSNASRLVDKLCEKKYAERKTSRSDRRRVDVVISDKGLQLLKTIDTDIQAMENELKTITKQEAQVLNDLLDKLRG